MAGPGPCTGPYAVCRSLNEESTVLIQRYPLAAWLLGSWGWQRISTFDQRGAQVRRPLPYEPVSPKHANGGDDGILALRLAAVQESIQD